MALRLWGPNVALKTTIGDDDLASGMVVRLAEPGCTLNTPSDVSLPQADFRVFCKGELRLFAALGSWAHVCRCLKPHVS